MNVRRLMRRILIGFAIVIAPLAVYLGVLVLLTPNVDHLWNQNPTRTSYMRLRAEQRGSDGIDRVDWTPLDEISPVLACAVIKAEDTGFFRHGGFEWGEIRKAFWANLSGRSSRGASTITQQLARNLYLTPDRSVHRKLREALIARRLEHSLSKRRILELYLNVIEWGDKVWGIKQAARVYVGRLPSELDAFESAYLASLLPAPRAPFDGQNRWHALGAQQRALYKLHLSGIIDSDRYNDAIARVHLLSSSLTQGRSVPDALADARAAHVEPASAAPPVAERISVDDALTTECGFAQELSNLGR